MLSTMKQHVWHYFVLLIIFLTTLQMKNPWSRLALFTDSHSNVKRWSSITSSKDQHVEKYLKEQQTALIPKHDILTRQQSTIATSHTHFLLSSPCHFQTSFHFLVLPYYIAEIAAVSSHWESNLTPLPILRCAILGFQQYVGQQQHRSYSRKQWPDVFDMPANACVLCDRRCAINSNPMSNPISNNMIILAH